MWYHFLADVVVAIHFAYVSFVVFGLLFVVAGIPLRWEWTRNFWLRIVHLVMILIVAGEALLGITCPLTTWEYQLTVAAGIAASERSFVGRLLDNLMFFDCPDNSVIWPIIYVGFASLVLLTFFVAPPRLKRRPTLPRVGQMA
jgi:Protein of Unknown function (DUF2784)